MGITLQHFYKLMSVHCGKIQGARRSYLIFMLQLVENVGSRLWVLSFYWQNLKIGQRLVATGMFSQKDIKRRLVAYCAGYISYGYNGKILLHSFKGHFCSKESRNSSLVVSRPAALSLSSSFISSQDRRDTGASVSRFLDVRLGISTVKGKPAQ